MPRKFINGHKAFNSGYDDASQAKPGQMFPTAKAVETPNAAYDNYYRAGIMAYQSGWMPVTGYEAAVGMLGIDSKPVHMAVLEATYTGGGDKPVAPLVSQSEKAYLVDCGDSIVRVSSNGSYRLGHALTIISASGGTLAEVTGIEHITALRDACEWAMAKAVEQKLKATQASEVPGQPAHTITLTNA